MIARRTDTRSGPTSGLALWRRRTAGLGLIALGLGHAALGAAVKPGRSDWLLPLGLSHGLIRAIGYVLCYGAFAGFVAAGLGVLGAPAVRAWWRRSAVGAALSSMVLLLLFPAAGAVFGVAADVLILGLVSTSSAAARAAARIAAGSTGSPGSKTSSASG